MGEIVNLRMARKQKARQEHDAAVAEARAAHGRTKAEREKTRLEGARAASTLDNHRLRKPGREE